MMSGCLINTGGLAVSLLETLDCEIKSYVEGTYDVLFGQVGWLGPILTSALTIYIAFFALALITGRAQINLSGLVSRLALVALVLTLSTRWGAYQAVLVDVLFDGANEIANVMASAENRGEVQASVPARLDLVLENMVVLAGSSGGIVGVSKPVRPRTVREATEAIKQTPPQPISSVPATKANLFWFSAAVLALGSIGLLIISKVLLGVLLAVGPLFIVFSLFSSTRGLFEGWLKTAMLYALVPLFTLVLTSGALQIIEPIIFSISETRALGGDETRGVLMLAVVSLVFGLLMFQVFRMSAQLTSGWRLPSTGSERFSSESGSERAVIDLKHHGGADARVMEIIASAERSSNAAVPQSGLPRIEAGAYLLAEHQTGKSTSARRPLGQSLRQHRGNRLAPVEVA